MTMRYFLGERRESQLCACLPFLRQKSPVAVRWLPPHRGRRSVEASLVELSLKTHLSVATSSLCVISKHESTTGVCQPRYRRRRCSEARFVVFSHKIHFFSRGEFVFLMPQTSRRVDKKQKRYERWGFIRTSCRVLVPVFFYASSPPNW